MDDKELRGRMQEAIRRVRQAIEGEASRQGLPPPRLVPHPPAAPEAIQALERHLQLALPPSYRAFLSLHDGYAGLAYGGDMLAIADMLPGSPVLERIKAWKRLSADYGSPEVLDGVVIASSTQPNQWLYIDPDKRRRDGEFGLVYWMGDTSEALNDLFDYFDFVVETCEPEPDAEE